ncbi:MAG: nitroreductase family protein [Lachnospiraceae bacterium]|nr:nitroreductase family protein [Lachnospiraceae bacterium]MDE6964654.1 nitroreductase family protein [Lachnospiraceae bacterium]
MNAKDCIRERRSIRKFKDQPIDHALLSEIVETASYAPSWKHTQIARYIAVEGELKDKIAAECTSAYPKNGEIIAKAPMLIAVTFIKGRSGFERDGSFSTSKGSDWQVFDAGIAAQTFCLAAFDKGIGSVIMGIFDEAKAASLLNLPEDRILAALVPVGYPDEEPAAPRRKPVEDLLSFQS